MRDDLLEKARQQAEQADLSLRAAALLRIARAESAGDVSQARRTLLEGLDLVRNLPRHLSAGYGLSSARRLLFEEARFVAAAVSPELLDEIPKGRHAPHTSSRIVQIMLAHSHVDAAFNYLVHHDDPDSFTFLMVGFVLQQLDPDNPECGARRLTLLRRTFEIWRRGSGRDDFYRDHFLGLFGDFWKEFPPEEALAMAHTIVAQASEKPDTGTSVSYPNGIHFTSPRQNTFFKILDVLRHLDPALAQSLIDSQDQLAVASRRYPNGTETMMEEAEAEAKRRKNDGSTCGGGYLLAGDPRDFDRQRRLIDATRGGDFGPSIEDAIEKYREDTSPATRNYAPKEYWPSTCAFRTVFYEAGKRLEAEAAKLLDQIPDDDLRLFASIELAAALAGVPAPAITQMKQTNPAHARGFENARFISFQATARGGTDCPKMCSPDGRLIRCPKCLFVPSADLRWSCKCGHTWNTFATSGKCPACNFKWEVTRCHHCGESSEHRAWYVSEP